MSRSAQTSIHWLSSLSIFLLAGLFWSGCLAACCAAEDEAVDKAAWAEKLLALKDSDWRTAFSTGLELADLPPDDGFAILKDNWNKIATVESRQQILKAWYFTLPYPLHERNHPHIAKVLALGAKDKSPEVREWAREFSAKGKPAAKKPKSSAAKKKIPEQEVDNGSAVSDIPVKDLRVSNDDKKRYLLVGDTEVAAPDDGFALLVVVPGGEGEASFVGFSRGMYKYALDEKWLVVQVVAPKWDENQFEQVVWPTAGLPYAAAKFTTEELIEAVVADVQANHKIDARRIFLLGWSSGGPPCYAATLRENSPITGAFIAMSVFKPDQVSSLKSAKGKLFYLQHSAEDQVAPVRFAEAAERSLRGSGAKVRLQRSKGPHGWQGDIWKAIADGTTWLSKQVPAKPKT